MPVADLRFERKLAPQAVTETYHYYTKPHPRYWLIQNKSWGAALLDLRQFDTLDQYLERIKGKNGGAFHARRARARGYTVTEIDRNAYIDAIHDINTSIKLRQGRPMDSPYQVKQTTFECLPNFRYYGVLNADGKLMAYANLGHYGNFSAFSQLIGYRNNDGVMHLMMVDIVARLISERRARYLMYDTFFGALPGMQQFKTILGFVPYRAKYSIQ